jgi:uncharacterized protein GlcG (DUF336 family)
MSMSLDRGDIGRATPGRHANGVTLRDAQRVLVGAVEWAAANGLLLAVAVDIGGHPVATARMDGASILAGEVVGIPLVKDGHVVGAVGASGGSAEQDQACSEAGARAAGFEL